MRLILPTSYVPLGNSPVIFLAGPVNGAPRWQDKSIEIIISKEPEIYLASPSTHVRSEYSENALRGNPEPSRLIWERTYLAFAAQKGAIMFWLPKQEEPMPMDGDFPSPYARDTRGELGEWRGRMAYDEKIRLVIGAEEKFSGIDVIRRNFLTVKPDMKFYSTLEETCDAAIKMALTGDDK